MKLYKNNCYGIVKCSVTNVWGYELIRADCSIRVSDCSIRVSRSGKSFLCQLCPENSGIILDSFTPSLFLKLFQHNSRIPNLVRPLLEYASPVWYLHTNKDINHLEAIQCRAARWVCGSRWNTHSYQWSKSSLSCQQELKWPSLQTGTKKIFCYSSGT